MIPGLRKMVIASVMKDGSKAEVDEEKSDDLEPLAEELLSAIEKGDAKEVATLFRLMCKQCSK